MVKKIIIYIILLALLIFFITKADFDFSLLLEITPTQFGLLSLFTILMFILNSIVFKMNMLIFDKKVSLHLSFIYNQATSLINLFPLKAGLVALGAMLKRNFNISVSGFIFINIVNYLSIIVVSLLVFIISLIIEPSIYFKLIEYLNFKTSLIAIPIILVAAFFLLKKVGIVKEKIESIRNIIKKRETYIPVLKIFTICIFIVLVIAVKLQYIFHFMGYSATFYEALIYSVFTNFSFLISFTPGGIGIKEGILTTSIYIITGNLEAGVMVAVIDRATNLLWTIIMGGYSLYYFDKFYSGENRC